MDVSFAVIVVQASDVALVADLIVALEAIDVLPLFSSVNIHLSFSSVGFVWCNVLSFHIT